MGTQGMKASLVSREVIADSIELVARGNLFDGLVGIGGCDKNMPGIVMALCRLDIPGMMLYGGSIAPGKLNGVDITAIQNVFEGIGSHAAGRIDDAGLEALEANACPGAGRAAVNSLPTQWRCQGRFLGFRPSIFPVCRYFKRQARCHTRGGTDSDGCRSRQSPPVADHHPQIN